MPRARKSRNGRDTEGAGDGDVTVTYTSLASKAALTPRGGFARGVRRLGTMTFR